MKQFIGMLTLAATVGLMQRADAQEFSYNYLQVGVATVGSEWLDLPKFSGQRFALSGSFEITDRVYSTGAYSTESADFDQTNRDGRVTIGYKQTILGLGLGYHIEPSELTSVYAEALIHPEHSFDLYVRGAVTSEGTYQGNAYGIALGMRQRLGERVELHGRFTHLQIRGDVSGGEKYSDDENTFSIDALFHTGMGVSVVGTVDISDGSVGDEDYDRTAYGLGLRYNF